VKITPPYSVDAVDVWFHAYLPHLKYSGLLRMKAAS
jgi:hypothetical protein